LPTTSVGPVLLFTAILLPTALSKISVELVLLRASKVPSIVLPAQLDEPPVRHARANGAVGVLRLDLSPR
jgi:hypothetical protein